MSVKDDLTAPSMPTSPGNSALLSPNLGTVMDWATGANGAFAQPGEWDVAGHATTAIPGAATVARFATGATSTYTVSGSPMIGAIDVTGDTVNLTGSIAVDGAVDPSAAVPGGDLADLRDDGALGIAAGATLTGTHTAMIGDARAAQLTIQGQLSDAAGLVGGAGVAHVDLTGAAAAWNLEQSLTVGGTAAAIVSVINGASLDVSGGQGLTVTNNGTLMLDGSATFAPAPLHLDGGMLLALADAADDGVTTTNLLSLDAGFTAHVGSHGGTTLTLNGLVLGSGTIEVDGGEVRLGTATALLSTYTTVVNGGTLDVNRLLTGNNGAIETVANTSNTIRVAGSASNLVSRGTDLIDVAGTAANVTATGAATIHSSVASLDVQLGQAGLTLFQDATGNSSLVGATSAAVAAFAGGTLDLTGLAGAFYYGASGQFDTTILGGAGSGTINSGTGTADIVLGAGPSLVNLMGADSVHVGTGDATVRAMGADTVAVSGGPGDLMFFGGTGAATVGGGSGSVSLFGGQGGGVLFSGSGGDSFLEAGGGTTVVVGIAAGDTLQGAAGGTDYLFAGAGPETLVGGGSDYLIGGAGGDAFQLAGTSDLVFGEGSGDTISGRAGSAIIVASGNSTIHAASDTSQVFASAGDSVDGVAGDMTVLAFGGNTTLQGGDAANAVLYGTSGNVVFGVATGETTIVTGTGSSTIQGGAADGTSEVFGSSGALSVQGGAGHMTLVNGAGATSLTLGSGSIDVYGGGGPDTYEVFAGHAGGHLSITGFRVGTDHLDLIGYTPAQLTQTSGGGASILHLVDGTTISLYGVAHPSPTFS